MVIRLGGRKENTVAISTIIAIQQAIRQENERHKKKLKELAKDKNNLIKRLEKKA